jgi:integrase
MSHQLRLIAVASAAAKLDPAATFHSLRHTCANHRVMAGAPLMVLAQVLGLADTRMVEKHYGHLAPSYVRDVIRAAALGLGAGEEPGAVVPLVRPAGRWVFRQFS